MYDEAYASKRFGPASAMGPLVLPYVEGQRRRIIYTITEYEPLLDSSNMTIDEWVRIAEDIKVRLIPFALLQPSNKINRYSFSTHTSSSMDLLSCMGPTPSPTLPRPFPLCWRTWGKLSSLLAPRFQSLRRAPTERTISLQH